MSDLGSIEAGLPPEIAGGMPEELSEEAKQRFAAAAAAMQRIRREEKKSRKRDDQVAQVIIQFLGDTGRSHLFVLISRLVARDCPSIFILAILSLIHRESRETVQEYLKESGRKTAEETVSENLALLRPGELDAATNRALIDWITRLKLVIFMNPTKSTL